MYTRNLQNNTIQELLLQFAQILDELKRRKVIRTRNNPVADYAEWLTAKALGLTLEKNSQSGFDGKDKSGVRFQIKSRRLDLTNQSHQLSIIRNLHKREFDYLVGIIFDHDFGVLEAYKIPYHLIIKYVKHNEHQHGEILQLSGGIVRDPNVEDITHIYNKLAISN
jgi:hypothetical protein